MTYKVHPAYFPLVHDSHGYLVISLTRSGDIPSSPSSPDLAINSLLSARICFPPYTLRRLSLHISTINQLTRRGEITYEQCHLSSLSRLVLDTLRSSNSSHSRAILSMATGISEKLWGIPFNLGNSTSAP